LKQLWGEQRVMWLLGTLLGLTVGSWVGTRTKDYVARQSRPRLIDWERARTLAVSMNVGSRLSASDRERLTWAYRSLVERAVPLISEYTGIAKPSAVDRVYAFDRIDWIDANLESFAEVLKPFEAPQPLPEQPAVRLGLLLWGGVNQMIATSEVGLLLGYLARRVLGQYDVVLLGREPLAGGQLYFVEPNIAWMEQVLRLDRADFRFWLVLHETTHAFEFECYPWVRRYLNDLIREWVRLLQEDAQALNRVWQVLRDMPTIVRRGTQRSWLELFMNPQQRALFHRLQAAMAVIEGYSNLVMHAVGQSVIPSYATIVRQVERRQQQRTAAEELFARLTGLDVKIEQYQLGEAFCRYVVEHQGHDLLRLIWRGPTYLPTLDELRVPERWIERTRRSLGALDGAERVID